MDSLSLLLKREMLTMSQLEIKNEKYDKILLMYSGGLEYI